MELEKKLKKYLCYLFCQMDYTQMELQILRYLSSTDMLNYCLALDKPMSTKLLPIFRKKIKNEVKKNRIKLPNKKYCTPIFVCECERIIGLEVRDETFDNPELGFCYVCYHHSCYDCLVDCTCGRATYCIDCILDDNKCYECNNVIKI